MKKLTFPNFWAGGLFRRQTWISRMELERLWLDRHSTLKEHTSHGAMVLFLLVLISLVD